MAELHPDAKVAFDNSPYLQVLYWPFARSDGTAGTQSRVKVQDGALVIALDAVTHEVYVIRVNRETEQGVISALEIPGGGIEAGDSPQETAKKELLEETGVGGDNDADWVPLFPEAGVNPIDGLVLTRQHAFLLLRGRPVQPPNDDEATTVTTMKLSELIQRDQRNEFHDPLVPYILRRGHDWLEAHRPELLT